MRILTIWHSKVFRKMDRRKHTRIRRWIPGGIYSNMHRKILRCSHGGTYRSIHSGLHREAHCRLHREVHSKIHSRVRNMSFRGFRVSYCGASAAKRSEAVLFMTVLLLRRDFLVASTRCARYFFVFSSLPLSLSFSCVLSLSFSPYVCLSVLLSVSLSLSLSPALLSMTCSLHDPTHSGQFCNHVCFCLFLSV